MEIGFVGLGLLIAGVALFATSMMTASKLDRAKFEGTNQFGVEEFGSYDDMMRVKLQRRRTGCSMQIGGLLILAGLILTAVGFIGGAEVSREQTTRARETAMRQAVADCQAGDVDACVASDYFRYCLQNDDPQACIYVDNYAAERQG